MPNSTHPFQNIPFSLSLFYYAILFLGLSIPINAYTHTDTDTYTQSLVSLFCLFPTAETWSSDKMTRATRLQTFVWYSFKNHRDPVVYWKILVSISVSLGSALRKNFTFCISEQAPWKRWRKFKKKKKKQSPKRLPLIILETLNKFFWHYFLHIINKEKQDCLVRLLQRLIKCESPNRVAGT